MSYINGGKENLNNTAPMKRMLFSLLFLFTAMTVWCSPSFAARQAVAGAGDSPLTATGVTSGVDMTAGAGTGRLIVGVVGGPDVNIFTNNNPVGTVPGQVAVSTDASSTSNILFNSGSTVYGDIGVTNPGGPFFLDLHAGTNNTTVNFLGSVYSTKVYADQTGRVNFKSGSTNYGATFLSGDGTISLSPNTTVIGALTNPGGANTGTLELGGGSFLDGAVGGAIGLRAINVVGGSDISGVSSTISGAVDAYTFNLGTNTLNIGGALTIANNGAGGVINTTAASSSLYGNILKPAGATNLAAGTTVNVNVTGALTPGAALTILNGPAGVDKALIVTDNSARYNFSGAYTGASGDITVTPVATMAASTMSSNNQNVATALDTTAGASTGDNRTVQNELSILSSDSALDDAYSQLDPTNNGGTTQAGFTTVNQAMGALSSHLGESGGKGPGSGVSTGDEWTDRGLWIKGFGNYTDQDDHKGVTGYDAAMWGMIAGMDGLVNPNTRVGFAGGYAATSVDGKNSSGDTDVDSYIGTLYLGYDDPSPWYFNAGLTFTWNDYAGTRPIVFGAINRVAKADYDGQVYTGFFDLGYVIPLDRLNVTPIGSLTYSHLDIGKYTETEAGSLNLAVDSQSYDMLQSGIGLKVDTTMENASGKWVPEAHFKWLYDFVGDQAATTSTFTGGGASFDTNGLDPAQSSYNVGAGVTFYSKGNISVTGTYDLNLKDDYVSHTGLGTMRYAF